VPLQCWVEETVAGT
jgi:hypothetical protein